MNPIRSGLRAFLLLGGLLPGILHAQTLRKLERNAINRTRITLVNGDTIQRFTTTLRQPSPKPNRLYYWQGQDRILRTVGAYNGHLLDGPYRLTDRTDRLLGAGKMKEGLKDGMWRKWRPDGSLASATRWRRGRQRGPTVLYDESSRPVPPAARVQPVPVVPTATITAVGTATAPRWWQPTYWKVKLKRRKAKALAPAPNPPTALPTAAPKKPRAPKSPKKTATPKKAGS